MKTTLIVALLTGIICLIASAGCSTTGQTDSLRVELRYNTDRECQDTVSAMMRAWNARDTTVSPENGRKERVFLHRLVTLGRRVEGRPIYGTVAQFWQRCYQDHASRYGDVKISARVAAK